MLKKLMLIIGMALGSSRVIMAASFSSSPSSPLSTASASSAEDTDLAKAQKTLQTLLEQKALLLEKIELARKKHHKVTPLLEELKRCEENIQMAEGMVIAHKVIALGKSMDHFYFNIWSKALRENINA